MGLEFNAFFLNVLGLCKREDLESAAVCEDCAFPVHELVKSACFGNNIASRSEPEVVGVGKDDAGAHFRDFFR